MKENEEINNENGFWNFGLLFICVPFLPILYIYFSIVIKWVCISAAVVMILLLIFQLISFNKEDIIHPSFTKKTKQFKTIYLIGWFLIVLLLVFSAVKLNDYIKIKDKQEDEIRKQEDEIRKIERTKTREQLTSIFNYVNIANTYFSPLPEEKILIKKNSIYITHTLKNSFSLDFDFDLSNSKLKNFDIDNGNKYFSNELAKSRYIMHFHFMSTIVGQYNDGRSAEEGNYEIFLIDLANNKVLGKGELFGGPPSTKVTKTYRNGEFLYSSGTSATAPSVEQIIEFLEKHFIVSGD